MLQRAACNLLPNGCYYGSFQRAAARKLRQVFRAEPITTDRKICHVRRETLHTLQSMPPAAQVRRSSRNTSYAAVTDHGVSGATSASLLQAAKQEAAEESLESPMPVLDENTTDASRKRRRIAPKAKIAADGAGVVPAELPQAQHQVTAADKALHDSAKAHKGRKSRAKPAIQPEAAVATGILAHPSTTASETGTATQTASRPAKGRMPKQPQAAVEEQTSAITAASGLTHTHPSTAAPATPKPMRTSKQTKSTPTVKTESADLDNSAGTAAHIAAAAPDTSTRNSKPPRRARQTKGKTAVKSEPAELDQLANEAPDATAVVSDTTKAMPACQGKQTKAKTAVKREPAELDPIANTARHASAEGPITDATEAVPAAEPRRPRAKAAVKVDIAEVIASLNVTPYRDRVKPDKWVGAHVSMGGGLERAVVRAAAIGAPCLLKCCQYTFHVCPTVIVHLSLLPMVVGVELPALVATHKCLSATVTMLLCIACVQCQALYQQAITSFG